MKYLPALLSVLICFASRATTYYVSALGNDVNVGTSLVSPWQTLARVSGFTFVAGDNILFRRGDTFTGTLVIHNSGDAGNPVTYSYYGLGNLPVINGFTTVTTWTNYAANIYRAPVATGGARINMLSLNGSNMAMGRMPKQTADYGGYATIDTRSAGSITSSYLAGKNFTGGEVVSRRNHDYISRNIITGQSGSTINFTDPDNYYGTGNGFFIQDHLSCLTAQGDWCYDQAAGYLYIYLVSAPTTYEIKVSTVDNLMTSYQKSNVVVDGISFQGANVNALSVDGYPSASNFQLLNSTIKYSGVNALHILNMSACTIQNNIIQFTNNNAIDNFYYLTNSVVQGNNIDQTGMFPGMGQNGFGTFLAIGCYLSAGTSFIGNSITNTGFSGLYLFGGNIVVKQNYVNGSCFNKDDGAGIYFGARTNDADFNTYSLNTVEQNIVLNTPGNRYGIINGEAWGSGIYFDDRNNNAICRNNSISNASLNGIFIHASYNMQIAGNTVYNSGNQAIFEANGGSYPNVTVNNLAFKNNILVAASPSQNVLKARSEYPDNRGGMGTFDSNYYYQPSITAASFYTSRKESGGTNGLGTGAQASDYHLTFTQWKGLNSNYEVHTTNQEFIQDANTRFEYNETATPKIILLPGVYHGLSGTTYYGTITLQPYTSAVLQMNTGAPGVTLLMPHKEISSYGSPASGVQMLH